MKPMVQKSFASRMKPTGKAACRRKASPESPLLLVLAFLFANQTRQLPLTMVESYRTFSSVRSRAANLVVTKPEKPARRLILCKAVGQSSRRRILQLLKKRVDDSAVRQEALMIVRAVILSGFLLLSNAAFAQHPSGSAPAPQPPPTLGLMLRVVPPGSVSLQTTQQQQ